MLILSLTIVQTHACSWLSGGQ